jgi:hypothetical protein
LIVENETCQHQLPRLDATLAVLGSGFDLQWMQASWLDEVDVAYWGDIDTWGLHFLAKARQYRPNLTALMMTSDLFNRYSKLEFANKKGYAVREPIPAGTEVPDTLLPDEQQLYNRLLAEDKGRLEQEYLPTEVVNEAVQAWCSTT